MKLYKFRPLANCTDLARAQHILESGTFRCSQFWELNDPMEGVYSFDPGSWSTEQVYQFYNDKCRHLICSFSAASALDDLRMWGYYANGFKGVAIEIEVDESNPCLRRVVYRDRIFDLSAGDIAADNIAERVLTTKLSCWCHEAEIRYIVKGESRFQKIGTLTRLLLGRPYRTTVNRSAAEAQSHVREYLCRVETLGVIASGLGLPIDEVDVVDERVQLTSWKRDRG